MSIEPKVNQLLQNLEQLFAQGQNSDVILKVQNREFPAHRAILSVRSPVFACMFNYDTTERASGVVVIPDCSAEVFEIFLHFLYTGNVDSISAENAYYVYYLADKYAIDDLKAYIIQFLKENLSIDNCCDVFTLSLRHSDLELQKLTVNFFSTHMLSIVNTPRWRKFLHESHIEVNSLLYQVIQTLKIK